MTDDERRRLWAALADWAEAREDVWRGLRNDEPDHYGKVVHAEKAKSAAESLVDEMIAHERQEAREEALLDRRALSREESSERLHELITLLQGEAMSLHDAISEVEATAQLIDEVLRRPQ